MWQITWHATHFQLANKPWSHPQQRSRRNKTRSRASKSWRWDKPDQPLKPYTDLKAELYESEVLLRLDQIISPVGLCTKIINIAHKQKHVELSKTKEMIRHILVAQNEQWNRELFWMPNYNSSQANTPSKNDRNPYRTMECTRNRFL